MRLYEVEIAQRVDGKFNVWAKVDYHEVTKEKQALPYPDRVWMPIFVGTGEEAKKFCEEQNIAAKILPTKYRH